MSEPTRAGDMPSMQELEEGKTYAWCACGNSSNQPFCDGSHAGTEFSPVVFVAEESGQKAMCMCKSTAGQPFCDGTHAG